MKIDLDKIEEVDDSVTDNVQDNENRTGAENPQIDAENTSVDPSYGSPEWTDYVLSLLTEKEKDSGYPKVDGLRRLTEKLIGQIIESHTTIIAASPTYAAAQYTLKIFNYNHQAVVHYGGAADAGTHNLSHPFDKFPTAMAETRAEGRALRKALGINVVVAEELDQGGGGGGIGQSLAVNADEPANETYSNTAQQNTINMMCRRLNINVKEFVNKTLDKDYNSIIGVEYVQAAELIKKLSEYQRNKDAIPAEFIGFTQQFE